jgi:hypothetical protein
MTQLSMLPLKGMLAIAAVVAIVAVSSSLGCTAQPTAPSRSGSALAPGELAPVKGGRPATTGVVFVTSQGLYYDTFVTNDPLPMHGKFQLLENGQTEFGPGDPGYLGGRWWEDLNQNGIQDTDDHFFHCPLLPPGRRTP